MQLVLIMIRSLLYQSNSLKKFKIKCTMQYLVKQQHKLFIIEQIKKKKIWVLLLGKTFLMVKS